jgi:glycosyltransferase involved in cell wall biosynthesis
MRVLHVNAGNLYGGIETLLVTLARCRSLASEIEPQFALCFEGRLSEELRHSEAAVHLLGPARCSRPWTLPRARGRLRALLRPGEYDLVVTHGCWPHALFAPVARRARVPVAFWAHALTTGRHWLERWASWCPPDVVLATSQATRDAAARLFRGVRSEVLYLPVAASAPLNREAARREVRSELGCPAEQRVIVTTCRLEPWKGHGLLLEALGNLAPQPGWEWWIAGGPQRPSEQRYLGGLRARVAALGLTARVRFLGQRSDVPRLLAAADVHCQANTGPEPFGIAFVEALYAGLPVVTTALGGAKEIVTETCGVLVPPGDTAALAGALGRVLTDDRWRQQLGSAGPARAAELCDPAARLGRLAGFLREVVGR